MCTEPQGPAAALPGGTGMSSLPCHQLAWPGRCSWAESSLLFAKGTISNLAAHWNPLGGALKIPVPGSRLSEGCGPNIGFGKLPG